MLKSVACFLILACLFCPLKSFSREITVCSGGKSSGYFISAKSSEIGKIVNFDGLSFSLTTAELAKFLSEYDCKKVYSSDIGGVENYYYYSSKISKKEVLSGKKVNVHIAVSSEKVVVGVPIIYYGY